jgi:hypothetical protein
MMFPHIFMALCFPPDLHRATAEIYGITLIMTFSPFRIRKNRLALIEPVFPVYPSNPGLRSQNPTFRN